MADVRESSNQNNAVTSEDHLNTVTSDTSAGKSQTNGENCESSETKVAEVIASNEVQTPSGSTEQKAGEMSGGEKSKVTTGARGTVEMGEKRKILPSVLANLRKKEMSTFSNKKVSDFFTLSAGADMLLSSAPVIRANPVEIAKRAEEERNAANKKPTLPPAKREYLEVDTERLPKPKRKNKSYIQEYYCDLCDSMSNSEQSYVLHCEGKKHKKKLAAAMGITSNSHDSNDLDEVQHIQFEKMIPPNRVKKSNCMPKIQTKLDRIDSASVGLNYIIELLRLDETLEPMYICYLCETICNPNTILAHIVGYKHRVNYLKVKDTDTYIKIKALSVKKSELSRILEKHAEQLEERDGRGIIVVEQEIKGPKDDDLDNGNEAFAPSNHDFLANVEPSGSQFTPSPFQIEDICFLPVERRMEMLCELGNIMPNEIITDADANRLQYILLNFKRSVTRYERKKMWENREASSINMNQMVAYPSTYQVSKGSGTWQRMTSKDQTPIFNAYRR